MESHSLPGSPHEVDVPQIARARLSQRQGPLCVCPGRMAQAGVTGTGTNQPNHWGMELHRWTAVDLGQHQRCESGQGPALAQPLRL